MNEEQKRAWDRAIAEAVAVCLRAKHPVADSCAATIGALAFISERLQAMLDELRADGSL